MATATITVTAVLTTTVKAPSSSAPSSSSTNRATPQGGILEGVLPNEYSASDPIKLFIIQVRIGGQSLFIYSDLDKTASYLMKKLCTTASQK